MKRNFTLTQIFYALALEETKNFRVAAKKCHVSQPTLSMQLQKLENELGAALFDRSKHPILPTELGEKILRQFRIILRETNQIDEILLGRHGELSGEFRLAIIPSLAPYLLPLFLPKFVEAHPKVSLVVDELITESILERLRRDELDAGILVTPTGADGIQETPLFYEPFWLYVADSHPLQKVREVRASEVDLSDVWLLEDGHCFRDQVFQLCKRKRSDTSPKKPLRFESGSLEVLRELVETGMGITFLPDLAVRKLTSNQHKKRIKPFAAPVPVREVSCVQSRLFNKKRVVDALIKIVRASVPKELLEREKLKIIPIHKQP